MSLQTQVDIELEIREREQNANLVASPYSTFKTKYRNDPVGFVLDCIRFPKGDEPSPYQLEALKLLPDKKRLSVRSPHGAGKTALASWIVLWFALTRDGEDWKIPCTASAWRQLSKYLFPELHKWVRRIRWEQVGRSTFDERTELLTLSIKLDTGEAFALASDRSELIEGAHAAQLLYLFDEAKIIPDDTWDSAEGAFASGEVYWLAISTPGEPNGRFYDIHSRKPGYEDWHVMHVSLEDAIDAGRISQAWADQRMKQWGEGSAVYKNRVLGEFASSEEDGIIALSWIERANERWHEWNEAERPGDFVCVGVDVARSGSDKTVQAMRFDEVISELRITSKEDTMTTAGRVAGVIRKHGGYAVVDVIGIGAGVYDRLRELKLKVRPFNAAAGTKKLDRSGELGYTNKRSAAWWNLREMLELDLATLPPDDILTGDLVAPRWRVMSGGRIQVESKDDIKKRIGRSTDYADAVVQAYWSEPRGVGML